MHFSSGAQVAAGRTTRATGIVRNRDRERDTRALAGACAVGPNASAVGFDQALADGEAQTAPALPIAAAAGAIFSEQVWQSLRIHPPALVADRDRDLNPVTQRGDLDRGGNRSVPDGVGEQVVQHLSDALPVGH